MPDDADTADDTRGDAGDDAGDDAERALVLDARRGDGAAFMRLADRYRPQVVRFLAAQLGGQRRLALDEVAQQTLDAAYDKLPRLRDPARVRSWLFSVARHRLLDALRRQGREVPLDQPDGLPGAPPPAVVPPALAAALDSLSPPVARMVRLRLQRYTAAEIAAHEGKSEQAVARALSRAVQALPILVQEEEDRRP